MPSIQELRAELRRLGRPTTGLKRHLEARLESNDGAPVDPRSAVNSRSAVTHAAPTPADSSPKLGGMVLCISGALSRPKAQVAKDIRNAGAGYSDTCTLSVTHLVCAHPGSQKALAAAKNGAQVVDEAWLTARLGSASDATTDATTDRVAGLAHGEATTVTGSTGTLYTVRNVGGGSLSCTCPAWKNQATAVNGRSCKHTCQVLDVDPSTVVRPPPPVRKGAPGVLLAARYDGARHKCSGWWVSEKLDGIRAYWDGEDLVSRAGNRFDAPAWFTDALPRDGLTLDGELFTGRGDFNTASSIIRSHGDPRWNDVVYLVFDAPSHAGPFEDRLGEVARRFGGRGCDPTAVELPDIVSAGGRVRVVEHVRLTDCGLLDGMLAAMDALGGEGLMLRRPGSEYRAGRSTAGAAATLLKLKSFHDMEAQVLRIVGGDGRNTGVMGALYCRLGPSKNSIEFKVGTGFTDAQRRDPPRVGDLITIRCPELTPAGVPRFPVFVGVRDDLTVEQCMG